MTTALTLFGYTILLLLLMNYRQKYISQEAVIDAYYRVNKELEAKSDMLREICSRMQKQERLEAGMYEQHDLFENL